MGELVQFVASCRAQNERLCALLRTWLQASESTFDLAQKSELSLKPPPAEPFSLAAELMKLRAAFPGVEVPFKPQFGHAESTLEEAAVEADQENPTDDEPEPANDRRAAAGDESTLAAGEVARKRLNTHLSELGICIAGVHGGLLETIAEILIESRLSRTLLTSADNFPVTGISVMAAIAAANLSYMAHGGRNEPLLVELPLGATHLHATRSSPGDLLFLDLIARSIVAAERNKVFGETGAAVMRRYVPVMIAASTLAKLDLALDLPAQWSARVDYRRWGGLECLAADPGSVSLRREVVGRLAIRCAKNPERGMRAAMPWLTGLLDLENAQVPAVLLGARFLWELLQASGAAVSAMTGKGPASQPLLALVARIEKLRSAPRQQGADSFEDLIRLSDVASCLDSYPAYVGMCEMVKLGSAPVRLSSAGSTLDSRKGEPS